MFLGRWKDVTERDIDRVRVGVAQTQITCKDTGQHTIAAHRWCLDLAVPVGAWRLTGCFNPSRNASGSMPGRTSLFTLSYSLALDD
jgi:hypothetical protein